MNGRPIAIMSCIQLCAAFLAYTGGYAGMRITRRMYGEALPPPSVTAFWARWGLWPLAIALAWTALVLFRAYREAPPWEMFLWYALAIVFCFFAGGGGILAAVAPLVVV